jgi:predicted phage baseplate assembly protein
VTNPLRSSGGTDPDTDAALRRRAALPTLAMGRIVGLRDYEDFTLARAGIGKAAATRLVVAGREIVQLTVAGVDDAPIDLDSDVLRGLLAACRRFGDPGVPVDAAPRTLWNLVVEARVGIEPDRSWALLEPQVRAALGLAFGFEARALAQSAYLAEAVAAVQAVQGVVFVDVTRFGATQGTAPADADAVTGTQPRALARPALPAQDDIHADPAELVTVSPDLAGFVVLHGEVVR